MFTLRIVIRSRKLYFMRLRVVAYLCYIDTKVVSLTDILLLARIGYWNVFGRGNQARTTPTKFHMLISVTNHRSIEDLDVHCSIRKNRFQLVISTILTNLGKLIKIRFGPVQI